MQQLKAQGFNRALCIVNIFKDKIGSIIKAVLIEHYVLWIQQNTD